MHEDETCDAYQERIQGEEKRKDEERLSVDKVRAISKACPHCGINLDKYTGCDHVTCTALFGPHAVRDVLTTG